MLTYAIRAFIDAAQRGIDTAELVSRLVEQGGQMLAFEGDRRALGVVLIVGVCRFDRIDDASAVALERGEPVEGRLPLCLKETARGSVRCHHSLLPPVLTWLVQLLERRADVHKTPGYGRLDIWQLTSSP